MPLSSSSTSFSLPSQLPYPLPLRENIAVAIVNASSSSPCPLSLRLPPDLDQAGGNWRHPVPYLGCVWALPHPGAWTSSAGGHQDRALCCHGRVAAGRCRRAAAATTATTILPLLPRRCRCCRCQVAAATATAAALTPPPLPCFRLRCRQAVAKAAAAFVFIVVVVVAAAATSALPLTPPRCRRCSAAALPGWLVIPVVGRPVNWLVGPYAFFWTCAALTFGIHDHRQILQKIWWWSKIWRRWLANAARFLTSPRSGTKKRPCKRSGLAKSKL